MQRVQGRLSQRESKGEFGRGDIGLNLLVFVLFDWLSQFAKVVTKQNDYIRVPFLGSEI
jgi:hypothetical protein